MDDVRITLERLIEEQGGNYGALSRMLGRNPAYIQQFIKRGTPRKLDEADRKTLARFFGVDEQVLGGASGAPISLPSRPGKRTVSTVAAIPRLTLGASAGPGSLDDDERPAGTVGFDRSWLRELGFFAKGISNIITHFYCNLLYT